jgi:Domain of unknown function (DUF4304)
VVKNQYRCAKFIATRYLQSAGEHNVRQWKKRMSKSEVVFEVDAIQSSIRNSLKEFGFKVRGRTFNRQTPDGLTQVINFQMGQSEPPSSVFIPGLKENFYGLFTVNIGVYVPEVAEFHGGCLAKSWVQEYNCCIRDRLFGGEPKIRLL